MTLAAYLRTSTEEQNLDGQRGSVEAWLVSQSMDLTKVRWYIDEGHSGDTLRRPSFQRLQRDIAAGKVTGVVAFALDRVSRKMVDGLNVLAKWLDQSVRVVILNPNIDVNGTTGQLMAAMLLGFAQLEQEHRRTRQRHGIAAAKRKGKYCGRKAGTTKAKPARAVELRDKGLSTSEIASAMNINQRTVQRYLRATEATTGLLKRDAA